MNAPISAALLQLRASAATTPAPQQSLIPVAARLLHVAHEHDGLVVDLYGELDAAGYDVQHVGLNHSLDRTDIGVWLTREQLRELSDWCDRHLPTAHDLNLVSQQEARAERMQWQRGFIPP